MNILGIKVDNLSKKEILEKVESFLRGDGFHQIVTVNPEFILQAQKDEEFKNILNDADLNVADGIGIKFAFWRFGKNLRARITGIDLLEEILQIASINNYKIFLCADSRGLSTWEETKKAILQKYPGLEIDGVNLDKSETICDPRYAIHDIVFCAFGSPYQEKFLNSLKSQKDTKIKLGMGVGGSFDYLTGKIRRAPKWMRNVGLEWLWRLILEPKYRFKRIFLAVVIFPIKIIFK
ncbi:MAG: WecB/TagA/CpsF family glycosyltransferase [Parcubacteria group bacterium]|jgi:N-acetylglucosaminyldiphosphoundecaprenol N-acetyl-beta-D-mannosaminyltransferase